MTKRIAGFAVAVLFALIGTGLLVAYVRTAEQRALAGEELVEVYVVSTGIPSGTPAEDLDGRLTIERVPLKVRADGAVDSLPALAGLVTTVDLMPGEQLVAGRFAERTQFTDRQAGIEVPEDLIEVTVELEAERAVGGLLEAGQTVAVLGSFGPFTIDGGVVDVNGETIPLPGAAALDLAAATPNSTDLLLRKVLVTAVQLPPEAAASASDREGRLTTAVEGSISVTLAVSPFDAERLVFTAEWGSIWLAIERETVPEGPEAGQTRGSVLLDRNGGAR